MKILFKSLFLIISLFLCACANDDDNTLNSFESNEDGYYLVKTEDSCSLCYKYFDTENLRKKSVGDVHSEIHESPLASWFMAAAYRACINTKKVPDYTFDLCGTWYITYDHQISNCGFSSLTFYDDGHFTGTTPIKSFNYTFGCYKIYCKNGNYYLKLSFFSTKNGEEETYGDNYKTLTMDDIYLEKEDTYLYSSEEFSFSLYKTSLLH